MKSKFIRDVEAFGKEMEKRLQETKEGGIIILAMDDKDILGQFTCSILQRRIMIRSLLADEDVQRDIIEILSSHKTE